MKRFSPPVLIVPFVYALLSICVLVLPLNRMMTEPAAIPQKETKRTILVVWAISATLVAVVSTGLAIFFFLQARQPLISQTPGVSASPFLDLPESAIPGPYKWISKSGSESLITLNADHTFSKGDTTNLFTAGRSPGMRW